MGPGGRFLEDGIAVCVLDDGGKGPRRRRDNSCTISGVKQLTLGHDKEAKLPRNRTADLGDQKEPQEEALEHDFWISGALVGLGGLSQDHGERAKVSE